MDFEMGFIESEQDIIAMQIQLMRHIFAYLKESCTGELALFGASLPEFETLPQILLKDAQELLLSKLGWRPKAEPSDLDPEGERLLCNHMLKEHGVDLVYVTHYPHALRPFYAMPEAQPNSTAAKSSRSFDLLFRGLEITTGGQRIHEYAQLIASMEERSLDPANFADYLQCFKYGMPPHGGLAIGLERLAKQLLGLPTVKLAALFPRDLNRLTP
jgi:nondiscriminating aspartyl-tRNA synthetase